MTEVKGSYGEGRDAERRRRFHELSGLLSPLPVEQVHRIFGKLHTLVLGEACDVIRTAINNAVHPVLDIEAARGRMNETLAAHPPKPLLHLRYREFMMAGLRKAIASTFCIEALLFDEQPVPGAADFCVRLNKPRLDILLRTLSWNGGAFTVRTAPDRLNKMPDEWQAISDGTLKFMFCAVEDETETYVKELVLVDLFQLFLQSANLKDSTKDCHNDRDGSSYLRCTIEKMPASVVIWRSRVA